MATVTFLNRKGVALDGKGIRKLLNSTQVREHLTGLAEEVLRHAQTNAPYWEGDYVDGLRIEQDTTDRVVVRVTGSTQHDWFVEAEFGTLSRAMDAAGVRR